MKKEVKLLVKYDKDYKAKKAEEENTERKR